MFFILAIASSSSEHQIFRQAVLASAVDSGAPSKRITAGGSVRHLLLSGCHDFAFFMVDVQVMQAAFVLCPPHVLRHDDSHSPRDRLSRYPSTMDDEGSCSIGCRGRQTEGQQTQRISLLRVDIWEDGVLTEAELWASAYERRQYGVSSGRISSIG